MAALIDLPLYAAEAEDLSALTALEAGWDTCPRCKSLAVVEASNPADEYVCRCLDIDCAYRYGVMIP